MMKLSIRKKIVYMSQSERRLFYVRNKFKRIMYIKESAERTVGFVLYFIFIQIVLVSNGR